MTAAKSRSSFHRLRASARTGGTTTRTWRRSNEICQTGFRKSGRLDNNEPAPLIARQPVGPVAEDKQNKRNPQRYTVGDPAEPARVGRYPQNSPPDDRDWAV
jgi:hypothetical protein